MNNFGLKVKFQGTNIAKKIDKAKKELSVIKKLRYFSSASENIL